jgi:tyrosine-protein kinase Etk/Wzc
MTSSFIPANSPDRNQISHGNKDGNDIKRFIALFISNWYWFAISLFAAVTIVYGINRYSERIYSVSSYLLIKDEKVGGGFQTDNTLASSTGLFQNQQNLRNEIGILKSFSLNRRVIDSLHEFQVIYMNIGRRNVTESKLYNDCPFVVISDSLDYQPKRVKLYVTINSNKQYSLKINGDYNITKELEFGQRFLWKGFDFIINLRYPEKFTMNDKTSNKFYFYFENPEDLANSYRGKLGIEPIDKDASLVQLSVSGSVPAQESDYLNKLMDFYIIQGIEVKNRIAEATIRFINNQLDSISTSLSKAEENLKNFKNTNKLINISQEGTIIQNRLIQLANEKIGLELQERYYNYLVNYLDSKSESGDIISPSTMGVTDQQLANLVQELASLQRQKKQITMNLLKNQTPVILMDESIANAKSSLTENITNSLNVVKNNISDVNNRISLVEKEISKLSRTEIQMINIQRIFDLNNTVYTFLLEKRAEAGIAKASNVSDNRIIDRAEIFNAICIRPKSRQNSALAIALGFLIPGILILLIYYFNDKIIDKDDIICKTNIPIIGYISHNDYHNEIPVKDKPGSVLAESFRSLRTSLKYLIKETEHPVISVTSTISSEGKTFISINLATIYAMLGKKVLLVGMDLRKPRIHKIFDISNDEGISKYLIGELNYNQTIKSTFIENLCFVPSGPVPPNPAELIESEKMKLFIKEVKKEFDIVIIDTPPFAIVSDALLISGLADVNIFVVRQRYTGKNTLELIEELYQTAKIKSTGIVINDISLSGYYGYGLRYGYSLGYGYSYGNSYYGQYSRHKYGFSDKEHGYYID